MVETSNNVLNNYFEALDYVEKIVESNPELTLLDQDQIQDDRRNRIDLRI